MLIVKVFCCFLFFVIGLGCVHAKQAGLDADVEAYCRYITEKNQAKTQALIAPDAIVRAQNSNNDTLLQNNLVSGLSKDLVDFSKAKEIRRLIHDECQYYQLSQEAKIYIQYAIPRVRSQALSYKLELIQTAKHKIQRVLRTISQRIEHHHDTLQHYHQMDLMLQRLINEERDIHIQLALERAPQMHQLKIKDLLAKIGAAEHQRQKTKNQLAKHYNWSLQVQVGAQQQYEDYPESKHTVQPYAGLFVRYNLGSMLSNKTMNKSLESYSDWKNKQINGIQNQLIELMRSVTMLRQAEQQRLDSLNSSYRQYSSLSQKVNVLDSTKAAHFGQQIEADSLFMQIEINYIKHLLALLDEMT
jgi:hypothetical protein